jgi:hypothetical protein
MSIRDAELPMGGQSQDDDSEVARRTGIKDRREFVKKLQGIIAERNGESA